VLTKQRSFAKIAAPCDEKETKLPPKKITMWKIADELQSPASRGARFRMKDLSCENRILLRAKVARTVFQRKISKNEPKSVSEKG
jgi:hypothetical protein